MTTKADKFHAALKPLTLRMAMDSISEEEMSDMLKEVWENWDEETAEWRDKHFGFDHVSYHTWICTWPLGPQPIYMQIEKDKLPSNWVGSGEDT